MSSLTMDEAWLEVEAMEKLSILSLHLETNETTVSSLTSGEATLDISFEENEFVGCALFGRGSLGKLLIPVLNETEFGSQLVSR